jgi:hypothetical protein
LACACAKLNPNALMSILSWPQLITSQPTVRLIVASAQCGSTKGQRYLAKLVLTWGVSEAWPMLIVGRMRMDPVSHGFGAIRNLSWLLGALFITMSASAPTSAMSSVPSQGIALMCKVSGVNAIRPATSEAAVCASFKQHIDRALAVQTQLVGSLPVKSRGEWITIDLHFLKSGTATADVVSRLRSKTTIHPQIAVDVMDKSLGSGEVGKLAREVARTISSTNENAG